MISTFYVVQKDGIPAVWQASPKRLVQLLKRKTGFTLAIEAPAETRRQALGKLRELFPQHRPVKAATQELH